MVVKSRNYYEGTLDEFKAFLQTLSDAQRVQLKKAFTLIGVPNETSGLVEDGYMYARGEYYRLSVTGGSFDPSQYKKLLASDYESATAVNDEDIVTKGYLEKHTSFEALN